MDLTPVAGVAGFAFGLAAKAARQRKLILPLQVFSYVCWTLYMVWHGALAAAAVNAIKLSVGLLGILLLKASGATRRTALGAVYAGGLPAVALLYQGPLDLLLLPALGLQYAALLAGSGSGFRRRILGSAFIWLMFNVLADLWVAAASASANIFIVMVAIFRYDSRRNENASRTWLTN